METIKCMICPLDKPEVRTSADVFADEQWAGSVIPGFEVPGWVFLRIRRHAEGLDQLCGPELATFGRRVRDLVGAVADVTGASATYLMMFGEENPHVHLLIAPRTEDIPADRRRGEILKLLSDRRDPEAALAMVEDLRAAYQLRAQEGGQLRPQLGPIT